MAAPRNRVTDGRRPPIAPRAAGRMLVASISIPSDAVGIESLAAKRIARYNNAVRKTTDEKATNSCGRRRRLADFGGRCAIARRRRQEADRSDATNRGQLVYGHDVGLRLQSDDSAQPHFGGSIRRLLSSRPRIETGWKLQGDRIVFQNHALLKTLGSSLKIGKYKGHLVLLPERPQTSDSKRSYALSNSFWRNTMEDGLEVPKTRPGKQTVRNGLILRRGRVPNRSVE